MKLLTALILITLGLNQVYAQASSDTQKVIQVAERYIRSQHQPNGEMMAKALHKKLAKRTYWLGANKQEFTLESSYQGMIRVAETYNRYGNKFPAQPRIDVQVLDIDQRVASIKLIADDWIDYMHLVKTDKGDWKIINVLWQYHDINKHQS